MDGGGGMAQQEDGAAGWWPEVRAQFRMATPMVVVQVGLFAMGMVDVIMVGHLGANVQTDMAGVAIGSAYSWIILAFGMGTLMALDPLVAQALGAGDRPAVTRDVQRAVVLGLALAVLASLALLVAGPVLTLLRSLAGRPAARELTVDKPGFRLSLRSDSALKGAS